MPPDSLRLILRDAEAGRIPDPEGVLRDRVSLLSGETNGLDGVLRLCLILTGIALGAFRTRIRRPTDAKADE